MFFRGLFRRPVDLDLVITPSGSKENPRFHISLKYAMTNRTFANVSGSFATLASAQMRCEAIRRESRFRVRRILTKPRKS